MRRFQANPNSPAYAELVALTRKTLGTVHELRDALQALLPALQSAWVYGSVTKQTDTAQLTLMSCWLARACSSARCRP